ncbi:hypothetical protein BDW71DRAFT_27209 [Aspergillus fruticulosus]
MLIKRQQRSSARVLRLLLFLLPPVLSPATLSDPCSEYDVAHSFQFSKLRKEQLILTPLLLR